MLEYNQFSLSALVCYVVVSSKSFSVFLRIIRLERKLLQSNVKHLFCDKAVSILSEQRLLHNCYYFAATYLPYFYILMKFSILSYLSSQIFSGYSLTQQFQVNCIYITKVKCTKNAQTFVLFINQRQYYRENTIYFVLLADQFTLGF